LLLGRRIGRYGDGCWQLPGGKPQGDDADRAATALRELHEETGLVGRAAVELASQVDDFPVVGKRYTTYFLGIEGVTGELVNREPDKNGGWDWFSLDALPTPLFMIHAPTLDAIRVFGKLRA
jgi:8-oxo-dGTP diphosphatase